MIRVILFLVVAGLVAAIVGWFAVEPGTVSLTFRGWQVETSVGLLVLAVVGLALAVMALAGLIGAIWQAPRRMRDWRARRRRVRGLKALAAGMVAVAAGDARAAHRAAERARDAAGETPLTLLLAAQAAQLEGDAGAAEKYFTAMLANPDTEFLGLRGLLIQAGRAGDHPRALAYAERAAKLRPRAAWPARAVFELAVKAGLWAEAEDALRRAIRYGAVDEARGRRHRAALYIAQSLEAERKGFDVEARRLAKRAARAARDFAPAHLRRAALERAAGNDGRARRILEHAFAAHPHAALAAAYLDAGGGEGAERARGRVVLAATLLRRAPDDPGALMAAGEAALEVGLWGKARSHLDDAEARLEARGEPVPAALYRLRARLAEAGDGDREAAAGWLMKAGEAAADPRWVCGACGASAAIWTPLCAHCQAFDSLDWRRPEAVAVLAAESDVMAAISGPGASPPAALTRI